MWRLVPSLFQGFFLKIRSFSFSSSDISSALEEKFGQFIDKTTEKSEINRNGTSISVNCVARSYFLTWYPFFSFVFDHGIRSTGIKLSYFLISPQIVNSHVSFRIDNMGNSKLVYFYVGDTNFCFRLKNICPFHLIFMIHDIVDKYLPVGASWNNFPFFKKFNASYRTWMLFCVQFKIVSHGIPYRNSSIFESKGN